MIGVVVFVVFFVPQVIEALKLKVPKNLADHAAYIESQYRLEPWVFAQYTVADAYLFVIESWMKSDGIDLAPVSALARLRASLFLCCTVLCCAV